MSASDTDVSSDSEETDSETESLDGVRANLGLTRQAVAERLGVSVSKVRSLERTGQLKFRKVNNENRFNAEDIEDYVLATEGKGDKIDPNPVLMKALAAASGHAEQLLKLVVEPSQRIADAQAKRIAELELRLAERDKAAQEHIAEQREWDRIQSEDKHKHKMQEEALATMKRLGLPILAKRFGIKLDLPEDGNTEQLSLEQKGQLADYVIEWLRSMPITDVKALKTVISDGHYEGLQTLRKMLGLPDE